MYQELCIGFQTNIVTRCNDSNTSKERLGILLGGQDRVQLNSRKVVGRKLLTAEQSNVNRSQILNETRFLLRDVSFVVQMSSEHE